MIICKVPFRISFVGGGTDFPHYYKKKNGCVIGGTINKYCYVSIRKINQIFKYKYRIVWSKNEIINDASLIKNPIVKSVFKLLKIKKKIEIHYQADLPKNSGIGSSSSFCVGLIDAFHKFSNIKISKKKLAKLAIEVEQKILKEYCGSQDQIWASYGGLRFIEFKKDGDFLVKNLNISKTKKKLLESNMLLMFTGYQRYSKQIEKNKNKNLTNKNKILDQIKTLTYKCKDILENKHNFDELGNLLNEYWVLKKKLSTKVSNDKIDNIYKNILKNGAIGAKLIGSGSGGFFLIYCKKNKQNNLKNKLRNFSFVNIKFTDVGSNIIYHSKN
jgi:D-glycero-alpha-D-manno-heptose-7-phosphate kinase|tara:strand:- start:172 stop:1158 length:987 start_codon:yes stop_codon:yes gene_type:complete